MYKIAIVEDDHAIASMYELKLKKNGFDVQVAFDGLVGLELVKRFRPDIILLYLKMPKMTGEDMLEKVRSTSWGADIRTIVLTNISRDEAPMKLRFLHVDRYIVKAHYTPTQVVEVVKE